MDYVFVLIVTHLFSLLFSGVHCTAPVQNGVPSPSHHPRQRGSYSPLPHIHLGNGLGPSWPSDIPHYSLLPGNCAIKLPGSSPQPEGELNGSTGLSGLNSRGTSTEIDCRTWVEKTNKVMQGIRNHRYWHDYYMLLITLFSLSLNYNMSSIFLSSANPPQKNSHVNKLISPDSPPLPLDNPSVLPPPLPMKSRDLLPRDSPSPKLQQPEDRPCDSPPLLTRSNTARVSFREPISSSYSMDEDEDEDENKEGLQEGEENQEDEDEGEGGFGSRLHLKKGVPPHMDLLGMPSGTLNINSFK